jgi:hypothetical protein
MTFRSWIIAVACALAAARANGQVAPPIRDNSFLVEEAYNQEGRVVQHISFFALSRDPHAWEYAFTQEWPVGGQRHQLSITIPFMHAADATGVGDVALNYRYQLAFDDATGNAVAPRLSVILPTGDAGEGRGTSSFGVQGNLPISWGLHPTLVTHWNVGGTWRPSVRALTGGRVSTRDLFAAASTIWLPVRTLNVMLEAAWTREAGEESAWISPGFRAAIDFPSGLQIVPGLAFPFGIGPTEGERRVLLYLSFEHGF